MTVYIQSQAAMNCNHFNYLQYTFFRTQVVNGLKKKIVDSCGSVGPFSRRFVALAA